MSRHRRPGATVEARAKIFRNGGSQAVRLPKECRLPGKDVIVRKMGDVVILVPVHRAWSPEFADFLLSRRGALLPARRQPKAREAREPLMP